MKKALLINPGAGLQPPRGLNRIALVMSRLAQLLADARKMISRILVALSLATLI